jgi:hypothetical protein
LIDDEASLVVPRKQSQGKLYFLDSTSLEISLSIVLLVLKLLLLQVFPMQSIVRSLVQESVPASFNKYYSMCPGTARFNLTWNPTREWMLVLLVDPRF